MFGFNLGRRKAEPAGELLTARLNARLQPLDRGEHFEDPLHDSLEFSGDGKVTGGGTQLADDPDGVEFCDIEISVKAADDATLRALIGELEALGAPKGSKIILDADGREIPFGVNEGLAVFLNGVDLDDEVYETCDFGYLTDEFDQLMGERGKFMSFWQGERETAVYCYGRSFDEMKAALEPFLASYPLCKGARVVQIA